MRQLLTMLVKPHERCGCPRCILIATCQDLYAVFKVQQSLGRIACHHENVAAQHHIHVISRNRGLLTLAFQATSMHTNLLKLPGSSTQLHLTCLDAVTTGLCPAMSAICPGPCCIRDEILVSVRFPWLFCNRAGPGEDRAFGISFEKVSWCKGVADIKSGLVICCERKPGHASTLTRRS